MTTALGTGLRRAAARLAPDLTPDGGLLARFLATRDEAAFALLVQRHAKMVFGTCRRVLGNSADADDAFQAAFVVLVRKAHSLTDRTCVGNFLYGVAFHTALKARAMATKRRAKEAKASRERERPESDELTRVLDEELTNLPDKYREPVVLCELEGVSRKDAAARLGVPEGTISSRLATAHRMLGKRLTARGFASVAVAAVLANQTFAVPETLAEAAVRAAADGPPAAVTQLVTEVSKMLLWNKLKAGAAVLAGVLLLGFGVGAMAPGFADDKPVVKAPVPKKEEPKKDEDLIQGLWEAETAQAHGKQVPAGDVYKVLKMRFKGNVVTTITEDGEANEAFALDTSASPKKLATHPEGKPKEKKDYAIYDLDGDTLKLCHNTDEGDAGALPTSFRAGPNDKDELIVFKRVKEEKQPAKKPDDAKLLQGTWVTKAVSMDPPMPVPPGARQELALHVLTFSNGDLTWVSFTPSDPKTRSTQTKPFKLDQTTTPKQLTSGDNDCVYELDGDTLKVAMYALTGGRPKGFNAKDSPPGKGHVWVIELVREKPAADKGYSLKDGEVLKLIAVPFPDEREAVFKQVNRDREMSDGPKGYRMVIPADGPELRQCFASTSAENGWPLGNALANVLGIDRMEIVADAKVLAVMFDADALVRPDTPAEKLLPALQAELKAKCGIDVTLEFKQMEREVVVASGTYLKRAGPNEIEPRHEYTLDTDEPKGKPNWGLNMFSPGFLPAIGGYVGRPVIDETNLKVLPQIQFALHEYHHQKPDDPKFKAPDPETVLKRLADQTGLTFKLEKRKVRALVVARADKKPEADKSYSLKDGEVLKLIAAPFPDEREEVFKLADKGHPFRTADEVLMAVTVKDGKPTSVHPFTNRNTPGSDAPGRPLALMVQSGLRIDMAKVADPNWLLDSTVLDADVVLKKGTVPTDLVAALSKELEAKCGVKVTLKFEEAEREVVVVSGKHTLNPAPLEADDGRVFGQMSVVHFFADDKVENANSLISVSGVLPGELAKFVGRPVIDESDLNKKAVQVKMTFHVQQPETDKTRAADRDPAKVLKNLEEQTGLTFKLEKRKVRVLVVTAAK